MLSDSDEECAEGDAGGDDESGRIAVDAVNHVDGVDDADTGHQREGDANPEAQLMQAEEPVEVVDVVSGEFHVRPNEAELYDQPEESGEVAPVVPHSHDQHCGHSHKAPVDAGAADEQPHGEAADEDAGIDGDAAHDGDGETVDLAGVGVVDNPVAPGIAEHEGIGEEFTIYQFTIYPSHKKTAAPKTGTAALSS